MSPVRSGAASQRQRRSDGGLDRATSFFSPMVRIPRALETHTDTPFTDGDPSTHRAGLARIAAAALAVSGDPLPEGASAPSASGAGVLQSPWTPALASRRARTWDGHGALSGGSASGRQSLALGRVGGPLAAALTAEGPVPTVEASSTTAPRPPKGPAPGRLCDSHPHDSLKDPAGDSRPPDPTVEQDFDPTAALLLRVERSAATDALSALGGHRGTEPRSAPIFVSAQHPQHRSSSPVGGAQRNQPQES